MNDRLNVEQIMSTLRDHCAPGKTANMVDCLDALESCDQIVSDGADSLRSLISGALHMLPDTKSTHPTAFGHSMGLSVDQLRDIDLRAMVRLMQMALDAADRLAEDVRSRVDEAGAWTVETRYEAASEESAAALDMH